jgi:hypothetical protein
MPMIDHRHLWHSGPFAVVVAYIQQFRLLFSQPDYLKTDRKYKEDLGHLFFYGLIGK